MVTMTGLLLRLTISMVGISQIGPVVAGGQLGARASWGGQAPAAARDPAVQRLAEEVRAKGWIVFSGQSPAGDWDLFLMRPDGSRLRNLTATPRYHEAAPQFSRDGRRLLYRRLAREETIDGNHYGTQGRLVLARNSGDT